MIRGFRGLWQLTKAITSRKNQYGIGHTTSKIQMKKPVAPKLVGNITRLQQIMANFLDHVNTQVEVAGWVRSVRKAGNGEFLFVELSDGSSIDSLQIVIFNTIEGYSQLKKIKNAYCIRAKGKLIGSDNKKNKIQLKISGSSGEFVKILGRCDDSNYPLATKYHKPETLREIAHLRPRTNLISSIMRVRNNLAYATHNFFQSHGFLYIHTPIITTSDCEGAGEMFQVTTLLPKSGKHTDIANNHGQIDYSQDFFKKPAGLTVSGQLSVESYCCSMSKVYTFGPTFRAEVSNTTRHLAQFWMIEPEIAFCQLDDVIGCAESYVKHCISYVLTNNSKDLLWLSNYQTMVKQIQNNKKETKEVNNSSELQLLQEIVKNRFTRLTYTQAIEVLKKQVQKGVKFQNQVEWGIDLSSEHQRHLCQRIYKGAIVISNYPKSVKPFYMKVNEDGKTVQSFDILVPGIGQIVGGSQRQDRLEVLEERIREMKLDPKLYWWYLDLRKFGSAPHGGFGLGFQRLTMLCTGVHNIRDVIPFPRTPNNAQF